MTSTKSKLASADATAFTLGMLVNQYQFYYSQYRVLMPSPPKVLFGDYENPSYEEALEFLKTPLAECFENIQKVIQDASLEATSGSATAVRQSIDRVCAQAEAYYDLYNFSRGISKTEPRERSRWMSLLGETAGHSFDAEQVIWYALYDCPDCPDFAIVKCVDGEHAALEPSAAAFLLGYCLDQGMHPTKVEELMCCLSKKRSVRGSDTPRLSSAAVPMTVQLPKRYRGSSEVQLVRSGEVIPAFDWFTRLLCLVKRYDWWSSVWKSLQLLNPKMRNDCFTVTTKSTPIDEWIQLLNKVRASVYAKLSYPWQRPNEIRDKWMYEQRSLGKTYKEIRSALSKHDKWDPISTDAGVRQAIQAFARHNQLPIPKSARGTNKKSK